MTRKEIDRLIEEHLAAEQAGDPDGSVAVYSDDVVHDLVGSALGTLRGPDEARRFYEFLTANINTEQMGVNHARYGDDFCVIEHQWHGTVPGEFMGITGHGRTISFRMLHLFEFNDGAISRENVWLDVASIIQQLNADEAVAAHA
jgi:steroid delta-isomerase-like uncharacterized protein